MSTNYQALVDEHRAYYGVGDRHLRIYRRLYADKTHFVYELIQNAEDASSSTLYLTLSDSELCAVNDGRLFSEQDVRAICSIGLSEKDLSQIGTFGIGFKAVYAYTEAPEVHSGDEHFCIRRFVEPEGITAPPDIQSMCEQGHTVFRLPFSQEIRPTDIKNLSNRLGRLHARTLLFLRNVKKIHWQDVSRQRFGVYHANRTSFERIPEADLVELSTEANGHKKPSEAFLIFRKLVQPPPEVVKRLLRQAEDEVERLRIERSARQVQRVEVAFQLEDDRIRPVDDSWLFAYLPTQQKTGFRFLFQARYQTTPARDNIPPDSPWNRWLVRETAKFFPSILSRIKTSGLLTPEFFDVLPLANDDIPDYLSSVYRSVASALKNRVLIPTDPNSFGCSRRVFYPHNEELRRLLRRRDIEELTGVSGAAWLHSDIRDLKHHARRFEVARTAGVQKIGPGELVDWLGTKDNAWYEAKSDRWLSSLYAYLSQQRALWQRMNSLPLARLENGQHVCPSAQLVFFPPEEKHQQTLVHPFLDTLPTLRITLVSTEHDTDVRSFLKQIGVKTFDHHKIIDQWLRPQYSQRGTPSLKQNLVHIQYLREALPEISSSSRNQLIPSLRGVPLLRAFRGVNKEEFGYVAPQQAYLPAAYTHDSDLETYFGSCSHVWFVDEVYLESSGNVGEWHSFFKDLGVADSPRRLRSPDPEPLTANEKAKLRDGAKHTRDVEVTDWVLDGFDCAVKQFVRQDTQAQEVAKALWRLLVRAVPLDYDKAGQFLTEFLQGTYRWYYNRRTSMATFEATTAKQLKETSWLLDIDGNFSPPGPLFQPSVENRQVLGTSVRFLHPDFDLKLTPAWLLASRLGISLYANVEAVLKYLYLLSNSRHASFDQVEPLYLFFQEKLRSREGDKNLWSGAYNELRSSLEQAFSEDALVFTPEPEPHWWRASEAFWEDESPVFGDLRGCLRKHYRGRLKSFFLAVGFSERASPVDTIRAILDLASTDSVTDTTAHRIRALYRRALHALMESEELQKDGAWQQVYAGKFWLGQQGQTRSFFHRDNLVQNDHDYLAHLFASELPFWVFADLSELANYLDIQGCSTARLEFEVFGESFPLVSWTNRLQTISDYIIRFLMSPPWSRSSNRLGSHNWLTDVKIQRVEHWLVGYVLKGVRVIDPEPRPGYFDSARSTVWLAMDAPEDEVPDLIGDALQDHFGVQELREFVKDLLSSEKEKVLQRWYRRGLLTSQVTFVPGWDVSEESRANRDMESEQETAESSIGEHEGAVSSATSGLARDAYAAYNAGSGVGDQVMRSKGSSHGWGGSGGGEESNEHRRLKQMIAQQPGLLESGMELLGIEYQFASQDKVDVLLKDSKGNPVAVEIETSQSMYPGNKLGLWQAIKYKHLAAVHWGIACRQARGILVAPVIPADVKSECLRYGIEFKEVSVDGYD